MAKLVLDKSEFDAQSIINRILEESGLFISELASETGVKVQAIHQMISRNSISLAYLMIVSKFLKVSLDWLVYGYDKNPGKETHIPPAAAEESKDYIEVSRIGGGVVPFPRELLSQGVDVSKLRAFLRLDRWILIDSSDCQVADGEFVFGSLERPVTRKCECLLDGTVAIEGLKSQTEKDLKKLKIVGRVVWRWQAGN